MISQGINVSNSNSGSTNVGWVQLNNSWYFYRPNGSMVKSGWVEWKNKWYYLDERGEMKVGIQNLGTRMEMINYS